MWYYNNEIITEIDTQYIGFIYLITNKLNGKMYIGKKKAIFKKKTTRVKRNDDGSIKKNKDGTKPKRKSTTYEFYQSDWIDYYGSSKLLLKDIELSGKDNFHREILHMCDTDALMTYLETKEIIDRKALLLETYYNDWFSAKVSKGNLLKYVGKI